MLSSVIGIIGKEFLILGGIAIFFYIIIEVIILQMIINAQYKLKSSIKYH